MHTNTLKYTVIRNRKQYNAYCEILENLIDSGDPALSEEIDLLTVLIERWDDQRNTFGHSDPIEIIRGLMAENGLRAVDLAEILNLSKGTVSKILNYRKGLSKETIRKLSSRFNMTQEAFNRPYPLKNSKSQLKDQSIHLRRKTKHSG